MNGQRIAELMADKDVMEYARRCARRYARQDEDREEYVQDAFIRLSKEKILDDEPIYAILDEIRRGIHAAYERKRYVQRQYLHGYSERLSKKKIKVKDLGHARYLTIKAIKLSPWYFAPEWLEYGLRKDSIRPTEYQLIIVG
jgi:predicted ATPase